MSLLVYLPDVIFLIVAAAVGAWIVPKQLIETIAFFFAFLFSAIAAVAWHGPLGLWTEPLWNELPKYLASKYIWLLCFLLIYVFAVLVFLKVFSVALPERTELDKKFERIGRRCFGLLTGYLVASTFLIAAQMFPGGRDFGGVLPPEPKFRAGPIMHIGPDYQLLTVADFLCNPGHPITGTPWHLRGPFFSSDIEHGDYNSFPLRYCLWREMMAERQ